MDFIMNKEQLLNKSSDRLIVITQHEFWCIEMVEQIYILVV